MEELERLRNKRLVIRTIMENLLERIANISAETDTDIIDTLHAQFLEKEQLLAELDKDIELRMVSVDELKKEVFDSQGFREKVLERKTILLRLLRQRMNEPLEASRISTENFNGITSKSIRLPKINMEKFDGDVSKWQEWWAQFDSSFHKNGNISKIEKFSYLKTLLSGTAADSIAGLSLTEVNYDKALEIMKERFGKNEVIISVHINKLLELQPVKDTSDVSELRKFLDTCCVQIRNLESAGIKIDSYGGLLFPLLTKLLPEEIVLEFNRKKESKDLWNVTELIEFLRREVENRERTAILRQKTGAEGDREPTRRPSDSSKFARKVSGKQFSTAALGTIVRSTCAFCDSSEHDSKDCKVTSVLERKDALRKRGRCFICLKERHIARLCRSKILCHRCRRRHNSLICENDKNEKKTVCDELPKAVQNSETVISSVAGHNVNKGVVLLQTATVLAEGSGGKAVIRCLIDGGSQRTFVKEDLAKTLGLPVLGKESLTVHAFGANKPEKIMTRRFKIKLKNLRNPEISLDLEALETPTICSANIQIPGPVIQDYLKEDGLQLADDIISQKDVPTITLLIGSDYYWKVVTGHTKRLTESLMAIETVFGWMIHGPTNVLTLDKESETHIMKVITIGSDDSEEQRSDEILKKFWDIEAIGVIDNQKSPNSENEAVLEKFNTSLKMVNGRYTARLPWKANHKFLEDNKDVAFQRFNVLIKRFKKEPELYYRYNDVIETYLNSGIVEKVTSETTNPDEKIYYLPHRAVIREDKSTTKLRVVFDASSHAKGAPSLNECLHSGPNLNPDLLALIMEFRLHPVVFTADIEQAFLQIALHDEDRNAARFFWLDGTLKPEGEVNVQVLRMTRVLFGVTASPFLLAATIKHHIDKYKERFPEACEILDRYLYVDDLVSGASNAEEALKLSSEAKMILGDANMNLRKWRTNSEDLRLKWINSKKIIFELDAEPKDTRMSPCKVLGILWHPETDEFKFHTEELFRFVNKCENTKRNILHTAGRIFDPLGFLNPYVIRVKTLFQELWKRKIGWDEELPNELQDKWKQWCDELHFVESINIPRYYLSDATEDAVEKIELHCFTDASPKAYGAVLYVRYSSESAGRTATSFILSKARVAPIRQLSLPRLELMGALIGARLTAHILPKFQNSYSVTVRCWTDSKITLNWINSDPHRWKPFIENRVLEIQEKTHPQLWSYCPGNWNPADLLTRGVSAKNLTDKGLWWNGPEFLKQAHESWPGESLPDLPAEVVESETRATSKKLVAVNSVVAENTSSVLEINDYGSLNKVIRVTAWIMRFINNTRNKNNREQGPITIEELNRAQRHWVKWSQMNSFESDIADLLKSGKVCRDSRIFAFQPFLDENKILRLRGRLQKSALTFDQKHPAILEGKDRFCKLLIQQAHVLVGHGGVADTLTQIRDTFWILRGRQRVKTILKKCIICKRFSVKPADQIAAPLPTERITESPPFNTVGVDFAGPLILKTTSGTEKGYILFISCAVTRAIHLELVPDTTVNSFLQAFRRFIGRRGVCATIFSDNAKTFKRASRDLAELWECIRHEDVVNYLNNHRIVWKFIVERAPWWGGFWERMVRSVKTFLRKILGRALLNVWEMSTVIIEIEAMMNSRPLTYTYSDLNEPEVLTPSHFLIGKRLITLPSGADCSDADVSMSKKDELTRRYKARQILLDNFWRRWQDAYLMDLRSVHYTTPPKMMHNLREGMLVLLQEKNLPRMKWKMGVVEKIYPSQDGYVRSCQIRLPDQKRVRRPIQRICPFEVN